MNQLTPDAAEVYFELTRLEFVLGLISWDFAIDRFLFLRDNAPDGELKKRIALICGVDEADADWQGHETEVQMEISVEPVIGWWAETIYESGVLFEFPDREPFCINLVVHGVKGVNQWMFNPFDADFFPSIPHGHHVQKKKQKLDAYLGWIYKNSKQIDREHRCVIISLWNNQSFRIMASNAINWYRRFNPAFQWRTTNPLKLPRKR